MVTSNSGFTLGSGSGSNKLAMGRGPKHALHGRKLAFGLKIALEVGFCFLKLHEIITIFVNLRLSLVSN